MSYMYVHALEFWSVYCLFVTGAFIVGLFGFGMTGATAIYVGVLMVVFFAAIIWMAITLPIKEYVIHRRNRRRRV